MICQEDILFNERGKILLAEKFVPVEFMIAFPPTCEFSLENDIEKTLLALVQCGAYIHFSAHSISLQVFIPIPHSLMLTGFLYK